MQDMQLKAWYIKCFTIQSFDRPFKLIYIRETRCLRFMTHPLFQRQFLYVMRLKYFLFRKLCFTLERLFAKETVNNAPLHLSYLA